VFTAGTLSTSYAESINSCLRKIGLHALGTSRLDSILKLRNYCKACNHSIKQCSKERRLLLDTYLQPAAVKVVSNGVLRHQAKQIERAEKQCSVLEENGASFTVQEIIERKLNKKLLIRRIAERRITWNEETNEVSCSCNALVYRGMPCIHIALVAVHKNYKIPLSCFNTRYCYLHDDLPHPQQGEGSHPPSPQPDQHHPDKPGDDARDVVEFIPSHEQHITEAYINAKFGDEESIRIRGEIRSLELLVLSELKPLTGLQGILDRLKSIRTSVKKEIDSLSLDNVAERRRQVPVVPHASQKNNNTSYKDVAEKVAQASAEAVLRNNISDQITSPRAKRRKHPPTQLSTLRARTSTDGTTVERAIAADQTTGSNQTSALVVQQGTEDFSLCG